MYIFIGMTHEYRPYVCTVCGHKDKIQTNHEGPVLHFCKGCSWKRDFAGKENSHYIPGLGNHTYRLFTFDASVNEVKHNTMAINLKNIRRLKESMSEAQKRRLLISLRSLKEGMGNIGGETDISNADNLSVSESEFTTAQKPESKVISKTFDTKGDFDSYVNQRRGIEMTPKEQQSILGYRTKPTQQDKFFIKYEVTDDFGNNNTTIVKKLKEGNQFCWTAFTKHESAEEEGKPEGSEEPNIEKGEKEEEPMLKERYPTQSTQTPTTRIKQSTPNRTTRPTPSIPSQQTRPSNVPSEPEDSGEVTVNDPIRIIKTRTFMDDNDGSNILSDFLEELDI